jgi:hypothetical protein
VASERAAFILSGTSKFNSSLPQSRGRASRALLVHHSGVEELLAGAIVGRKAAHHADGKEELDCFRLVAVASTNDAAEVDAIEIYVARKIVEERTNEMRNLLVESERCQLITGRCHRGVEWLSTTADELRAGSQRRLPAHRERSALVFQGLVIRSMAS